MDWRHAYESTRIRLENDLKLARDRGMTTYRFGQRGRLVDPTRLSADKLRDLARREAAVITDRAINKHNEDIERQARK